MDTVLERAVGPCCLAQQIVAMTGGWRQDGEEQDGGRDATPHQR
jgi:hypothetical protein